jgi:hypothetical protein
MNSENGGEAATGRTGSRKWATLFQERATKFSRREGQRLRRAVGTGASGPQMAETRLARSMRSFWLKSIELTMC